MCIRDSLGDQLVGRVAARREHRDDAVAGIARGDDPLRRAPNLLGACNRGAAELHHDYVGTLLAHHERLRIDALKPVRAKDLLELLSVIAFTVATATF